MKVIKKKKLEKVDLVLEKAHNHGGVDYVAGDTITVNISQADRLEETRVGFRKRPTKVSEQSEDNSGNAPDET